MTAGREQDARETLRADLTRELSRAGHLPPDRRLDVPVGLLREALAALLPSPPATTGAGRDRICTGTIDCRAAPHIHGCYAEIPPPATDGDAADGCECPTCGGIHRHGGDCHGEGKPARDTETETR